MPRTFSGRCGMVLTVAQDTIGPVLAAVDTIKLILRGLEVEGTEPEGDDTGKASVSVFLNRRIQAAR